MNARSLLVVMVILGGMCIALTSQSTLTPKRGGDHVFYGAERDHFISEEAAVGNFDGDEFDDVVSTIKWDRPDCGGWKYKYWDDTAQNDPCAVGWTIFAAENGGDTVRVCQFAVQEDHEEHWSHWECLGWDSIPGSSASCAPCSTAEFRTENQGAALVFLGGDWSGKGHDIDLALGGQDHMILGRVDAGQIYNAIAAGDMDDDDHDELVLGAPGAGAGEVYVIRGSDAWPDTIDLDNSNRFETWVRHYFVGRDTGDEFGLGVAMGDLNGDGDLDVIIAAPGMDNNTGAVYVFYAGVSLPDTVDLSQLTDNQSGSYAQVIRGAAEGDRLGVTHLTNLHPPHHERGEHAGGYNPVGLAVGPWDSDDGTNDLVIGAGEADGDAGRAYAIFGGGSPAKLAPGNEIELSNTPSGSSDACDVRVEGDGESKLGAGVALVDADGGDGGRDLLIGAPAASGDGKSNRGEVYIIFGDTKTSLTDDDIRDVTNADHTDVVIYGDAANVQLGGHFSGNLNVDDDGKNDIGIAGQRNMTVIFGQDREAWESEVDLASVLEEQPELRVLRFEPEQYARSTTILLADLDGDDYHDLVFGGYDSPGHSPSDPSGDAGVQHGGQMWVTKGSDLWKSGEISANATWSGNVFVHGDLVVEDGVTLTIAAGTDVWIWPKDPDSSDDVWPSYPLHFDTTRVEFRVYGNLVVNGTSGENEGVRFLAWTMDGLVTDEPDLWWGIHVHEGSATFDYCEIRNARHALSANTPLTITNSTIEHAEIIGLDVAGTDSVYADNLTIQDIGYMGIKINGMRVRLSNSELSEVADYGIDAFNGAKLYVDNTTIRDADIEAISIEDEDTYASIIDCTIEDNYRGLRAENDAVMVVEGTTVDESDNYGIYSLYDATLGVEDCTVTNADAGIAIFESNATLIGNLLQNNDVGLLSLQGSAPTVEGSDIGYNGIGVLAMQGGLPMMGYGGGYGNNEIHHSTTYHVSNLTTSDTLRAESNHWKITTPPCFPVSSKINGKVDYIPALCSPPSPVSNRPTVPTEIPVAYGLSPNYPNPFNPNTTVPFAVPSPGGKVTIAIFNVRGQLVRTLVNGTKQAGFHTVVWEGVNNQGNTLSSGVYFLHMRAPGFQQTRKLVLLK